MNGSPPQPIAEAPVVLSERHERYSAVRGLQ
jgi:hypothetical protein